MCGSFKINISKAKYFILLLAIIKPSYLPAKWMLYTYRSVEAIGLMVLIFDYVKNSKKKNQRLLMICTIFYFTLLFSTVINRGSIIDLLQNFLATTYVILWFDSVMKGKPGQGIEVLMLVFEVIIYANYISILLFPQGLYRALDSVTDARYGWILGHQALLIMYAAPAICISQIYRKTTRGWWGVFRSMLLLGISVLSVFTVSGATGMFSIVFIFGLTFIFCLLSLKKFWFWPIYVGIAVITMMIVVLSITKFMEPIVTGILHRSMQFTGRKPIWDRALALIAAHPVFGYGVQSEEIARSHIIAVHAHDMYLHCLYQGGIFCLISFCVMCFVSFGRLTKFIGTFPGKILTASVISLLVQMIFEVYFFHNIGCILFCLSYYFPLYYGKALSQGGRIMKIEIEK